jgi:hypothetical protein
MPDPMPAPSGAASFWNLSSVTSAHTFAGRGLADDLGPRDQAEGCSRNIFGEGDDMATFGLVEYKDASPEVRAVYDDIMELTALGY